jgi:TnpA family transposase
MATHIKILTHSDIKAFDLPPVFNIEERNRFFDSPKWADTFVKNLRSPTNQVGFVLQLGYFFAVNRFFIAKKFYCKDIEFVCKKLEISISEIDIEQYVKGTYKRHQEIILEKLGINKFDDRSKSILKTEAISLSANQIKPRLMFLSLVDFLRKKKIEVPTYHTFAEVITEALKQFEKSLVSSIKDHLSKADRVLLDGLLTVDEEYLTEKQDAKIKRYKITLLKTSSQSLRPMKIKENVEDLESLKNLFEQATPLVKQLHLSPETIKYYAQVVIKSQVFQISHREDNRYLLLIAFVIHQYYQLNDDLVDAMVQSTQSAKNSPVKENKEKFYEARVPQHQSNRELYRVAGGQLTTLDTIRGIITDKKLTDNEKVRAIEELFSEKSRGDCSETRAKLLALEKESTRIINKDDYYDVLEDHSLKLQNRASEIVKHIDFDQATSNPRLFEAIAHFKRKAGKLDGNVPVDFLDSDEQKILFDEKGKLRISLYKILLFQYITDSIKSGALNLCHSYKFRAFNEYLIPKEVWESKKEELLDRAGLTRFVDFHKVQSDLAKTLKEQYRITNENINTKKNKYARFDARNNLIVTTPAVEKTPTGSVAEFFPKNRLISLHEVLSNVNNVTNFTDSFEHRQIKYNGKKPHEKTFFAGIIGYGCNLGIGKIAKISSDINHNELENTVNWYFSPENLEDANDKILQLSNRIPLTTIYNRKDGLTHTSSDGKKYNISVDSLTARRSYKYFGQDMGITVYTFVDHRNLLFYSTIMSPSEREAPYVIDGAMHNDVVKTDIHSTDTHGYSELIFGVTHLLGISFAPRIKNFKKQRIYAFEKASDLKAIGYRVLPDGKINTDPEQWDDILRFAATIILKEVTASQLFRRLSSYSRQHPLYKALKQFGRIIKSIFLLRYIDDVELRQAIEKQLNKVENINKFGGAVFNANNQEFPQSTRGEQIVADGCTRLIENAIICWNYLFLSQLIFHKESQDGKIEVINTLKNGSIVTWQHINLQGEYDFSDKTLENSFEFKLPEILDVEIS